MATTVKDSEEKTPRFGFRKGSQPKMRVDLQASRKEPETKKQIVTKDPVNSPKTKELPPIPKKVVEPNPLSNSDADIFNGEKPKSKVLDLNSQELVVDDIPSTIARTKQGSLQSHTPTQQTLTKMSKNRILFSGLCDPPTVPLPMPAPDAVAYVGPPDSMKTSTEPSGPLISFAPPPRPVRPPAPTEKPFWRENSLKSPKPELPEAEIVTTSVPDNTPPVTEEVLTPKAETPSKKFRREKTKAIILGKDELADIFTDQ